MTVNALRGEAAFEHDFGEGAKTLTLVFDVAAFLRFEDATGIGLFRIDEALAKLGMTAELLRAGLGDGEDLTREAAAEILMTNSAARGAVIAALDRALPKGDAKNPPKAARKSGTGKSS